VESGKVQSALVPLQELVNYLVVLIAYAVGLLDGKRGFDSSRALWKDAGWREIREIRKMLEVPHPHIHNTI